MHTLSDPPVAAYALEGFGDARRDSLGLCLFVPRTWGVGSMVARSRLSRLRTESGRERTTS